ncbi:MAG: hypothetical protein WCT23_09600 [Candidatus Neomarinimicrobiota bacterium]
MANYAASLKQKAQLRLNEMMQMPEFRYKSNPALMLALKNSGITLPAYNDYLNGKSSDQRDVETLMIIRSSEDLGTARAYNHTGSLGDSAATALTWNTFTRTFKYTLKQEDRNQFNATEIFAKQLYNAFIDINNGIGTAAQAFLSTNKNQVSVSSPKGATWDATAQAYVIDAVDQERYIQKIKSIMRQDYFNGMYDVIADSLKYQDLEHYAAQGSGNETNYGYQYSGLNIAESTEMDVPDGYNGGAYIMPVGTFAALPWIPKKNIEGWGSYNDSIGGYGTVVDPISGLTMAYHQYASGADNDTSGSETQDVDFQCEVSIDLGFTTAPINVTNKSVINLTVQGK